jgi:hypothetical protein
MQPLNIPSIYEILPNGNVEPISEAERALLLPKLRCGQNATTQPVARCIKYTPDRRTV